MASDVVRSEVRTSASCGRKPHERRAELRARVVDSTELQGPSGAGASVESPTLSNAVNEWFPSACWWHPTLRDLGGDSQVEILVPQDTATFGTFGGRPSASLPSP